MANMKLAVGAGGCVNYTLELLFVVKANRSHSKVSKMNQKLLKRTVQDGRRYSTILTELLIQAMKTTKMMKKMIRTQNILIINHLLDVTD